jgi:hypothetical protein
MMVIPRSLALMAMLLILILAACGPAAAPTPTAPTEAPEAVDAAKEALSQELGIAVDDIETVSYESTEWPNACLGLEQAGEMCAQVVTPGYEITLRAQGEEYVYRTDTAGDIVRRDPAEN